MLLDTCIVIDLLRLRTEATAFLHRLRERPSVSAITVAEVFAGFRSQNDENAGRRFLRECRVLAVSPAIAESAGAALRHYRSSHSVGIADALIAATAEHHGLELATLNVKHFPMFKKLKAAY